LVDVDWRAYRRNMPRVSQSLIVASSRLLKFYLGTG